MNIKKYINMILLKLSLKYKISYIEINTYKDYKKYKNIKLTIFSYENKKNKYIETKNDRELLLKLKEMI